MRPCLPRRALAVLGGLRFAATSRARSSLPPDLRYARDLSNELLREASFQTWRDGTGGLGRLTLMVHVMTKNLELTGADESAELVGRTWAAGGIFGTDAVRAIE